MNEQSGWIEYGGEGCPVTPNSRVAVRFRDGCEISTRPAAFWDWSILGHTTTIIAYRILDQAAAQQSAISEIDMMREHAKSSVGAPVAAAPIDPNARMLAADQRGASADQASLQPAPVVVTAPGRPTHPGLLMVADPDKRQVWGAME